MSSNLSPTQRHALRDGTVPGWSPRKDKPVRESLNDELRQFGARQFEAQAKASVDLRSGILGEHDENPLNAAHNGTEGELESEGTPPRSPQSSTPPVPVVHYRGPTIVQCKEGGFDVLAEHWWLSESVGWLPREPDAPVDPVGWFASFSMAVHYLGLYGPPPAHRPVRDRLDNDERNFGHERRDWDEPRRAADPQDREQGEEVGDE